MTDELTPLSAPPGVADPPPEAPVALSPFTPGSENPCGPTTANRDEGRFIIVRANGSGEREVTADKYESLMRDSPDWIVKFTNCVAPHHSDNV